MKLRLLNAFLLAIALLIMPACDQVKQQIASFTHKDSHSTSHKVHQHDEEAVSKDHDDDDHDDDEEHDEHGKAQGHEHLAHKILVTSPISRDVTSTQSYVCQIHSCKHIEIKALESGYLEEIPVREGQYVNQGDSMFRVVPALYQAKLDTELAEAQLVQIEYNNAKKLYDQRVVSDQEVALAQAKLAKAHAQVKLSQAELNFAHIRAPFSGIIDRLQCQQGSLVAEGDVLTTLSDNSVMWVYFNVPEVRYLEYQASLGVDDPNLVIELQLANQSKFPQAGRIGAIEADFNNETGNIAFRADFPNPNGLLRHGQTGNVLINRLLKDAVVIPQRATFEILAKRYVFVVDDGGLVHQREIEVKTELDDIFVLQSGVTVGEKIILEGIRQVRDGDHVDFDFRDPVEVLSNLKNKAE